MLSYDTKASAFTLTDTKLYIPAITLSTQGNAKVLHLKSSFKRKVNRNKYQSKATIQVTNPYLDYLINPSFQGVNRFFYCLKNTIDRTVHTKYYLPTAGF